MIKFRLKKTLIIIVSILFFNLSLTAGENFSLNLDAGFGFLNGSISEYVFDKRCLNKDNMLSRLNWDVSWIPYFEAEANADIYKYFHFSAVGKIGIPKTSGYMQDYDWLNRDFHHSSWFSDPPDQLTNYSKHTNQVEEYYGVSFLLGGNIDLPEKNIKIIPFLAYDYWYIQFEAFDGFSNYKIESPDIFEFHTYKGSVISYKQEYNTVLLGAKLLYSPSPLFVLDTSIMISPFLTFNTSLDNHKARGDYFLDTIKNAFEIKGKIKASYYANKNITIGFSSSIQFIPVSRGYDYNPTVVDGVIYVDLDSPLPNILGGTSSILWDFSINIGYHF